MTFCYPYVTQEHDKRHFIGRSELLVEAMGSVLLTDLKIRKMTGQASKRTEVWDAKLPGFGVRISTRGTKSFVLMYRFGGRLRRHTIGRYPVMGLAQARSQAQTILLKAGLGEDPMSVNGRRIPAGCFAEVKEDFVRLHCLRNNKPSTVRSTQRLLDKEFLPYWRDRLVGGLGKSDILEILDGIVERGAPGAANHAYAAISKFFGWCSERDLIGSNPCTEIKRPTKVSSRDRVLNCEELVHVWMASEKVGYPFGAIVRLLVLTAQRRGEVANMRWAHISFDDAVWHLPKELTKSNRAHVIPLTSSCRQLIQDLPGLHEEFLFPARGSTTTTFSGFGKCKERLDRLVGIDDWTLHDLRRTAATGMAELGVAPHVVEKVLNHASGTFSGVTGVYNRFGYLEAAREALTLWEGRIRELIAKQR